MSEAESPYIDLTSHIVEFLCGETSTADLSRELGFRTNVVQTWKAGKRNPSPENLANLAKACGHDSRKWLEALYPSPSKAWSKSSVFPWDEVLRELRGGQSLSEIALVVDVPRGTLGRWLALASGPRFHQLLMLIDKLGHRLDFFVTGIVGKERSQRAPFDTWCRAQQIRENAPIDTITAHLWTQLSAQPEYTLSIEALAEHLDATGVAPRARVLARIDALVESGLLLSRDGALTPSGRDPLIVPEGAAAHWHAYLLESVARECREDPEIGALSSYMVSSSPDEQRQLEELHTEFRAKQRALIASFQGKGAVTAAGSWLRRVPIAGALPED